MDSNGSRCTSRRIMVLRLHAKSATSLQAAAAGAARAIWADDVG